MSSCAVARCCDSYTLPTVTDAHVSILLLLTKALYSRDKAHLIRDHPDYRTSLPPESLSASTTALTRCAFSLVVTNSASGVSTTMMSFTPIRLITR